jgi:hypothetical protein
MTLLVTPALLVLGERRLPGLSRLRRPPARA